MRLVPTVGSLVLVLASLPAGAQPKPPAPAVRGDVEARLAHLEGALDQLGHDAASLPELQKTIGELAAQVAALRQDVDKLSHANAGQGDLVARLDALDARVARLAEQVSSTRADLDSRTGPESVPARGQGGGAGGGWDDGFHLVDGERFSLRATGTLQLRYTLATAEAADPGKTFPSVTENGFSLRRARLGFDGHVHSPRLTYRLLAELAGQNVRLLDYFVEGQLPHGVFLRGGQLEVPFARELRASESARTFLELPVATDEMRYDRDLGFVAGWVGVNGKLEANLGVFNGAGRDVSGNDNLDALFVARVQGTVLGQPWQPEEGDLPGTHEPSLVVGVSGSFEDAPVPSQVGYGDNVLSENASDDAKRFDSDVDGDGRRDNVRVSMIGADLAFRFRGLGVEAELYARAENWGAIASGQPNNLGFDPTRKYYGGFAQASYYVLPGRLQVGARYASTGVSPLLLGGRTRAEAPADDQRRELSGVVSYHRFGHGTELTLMYSFLDWYNRGGNDRKGLGEHRVLIETQIAF